MNALRAMLLCGLVLAPSAVLYGAPTWTEGVNYFLIQPARPPALPKGQIAVTEVFSYGCPACNAFLPTMRKLQKSLPPNAVIDYLPASFNPGEDWPMLQLAYFTAQALGVADKMHDAMFDAVWGSGELAIMDSSNNVKAHLPTIEDAARFYERHAGVPVEKFLSTSKSFSVDLKVRNAESLIAAYRVDRTPTIVVNGKYRLQVQSAGGPDQVVELVKWLVAKESQ